MLSAAFLASAQVQLARADVMELREMEPTPVSMTCLVRTGQLSQRQDHALRMALAKMQQGSPRHSEGTIRDLLGGSSVMIERLPAHVRISMGGPPEAGQSALSILFGLLTQVKFEVTDLVALEQALAEQGPDPVWTWHLESSRDSRPVTLPELRQVYHSVFQPKNISIAIHGGAGQTDFTSQWRTLEDEWTVRPTNEFFLNAAETPNQKLRIGQISLVGSSASWRPDRHLALCALGIGKGSLIFKAWRETMGISYAQEAAWLPMAEGFAPVFWAKTDDETVRSEPETMRKQLLDGIEGWTEADRVRALGIQRGIEKGTVPFGAFVSTPSRTATGGNAMDRTFLQALWLSQMRSRQDPNQLSAQLEGVTLDEMKQAATEMVKSAVVHVSDSETSVSAGMVSR